MRKNIVIAIILFLIAQSGNAQVNLLWDKHYNGAGNSIDKAVDMIIDNDGNIVVTGITGTPDTSSILFDIITIKYDPSGNTLWTKVYSSINASCEVADVCIDSLNNIYLTGFVQRDWVKKMLTIKYTSEGNIVWVKEFGEQNIDFAGKAVVVDKVNAIYVVGNGGDINTEKIYLIKYNSDGDTLWTRSLSYSTNGGTIARCAAIDDFGNIFVAGDYQVSGAFSFTNFLTVKYLSNGDTAWGRFYDGPLNAFDFINVIKTDNSGNVYVSGLSEADYGGGPEGDFATIKYDNNGNELWVARYDGGYGGEWPTDMMIDNNGSVYVTGWSISELNTKDAATVKYNTTGQEQWVYRYNGDGFYFNEPASLGLTKSNIVLVAGQVSDTDFTQDWVLVAIDNNSGDSLWTVRYDGSGINVDLDTPNKLLLDDYDNIYITGFTDQAGNDWDITTIKYSAPTSSIDEHNSLPLFITLEQNYPNPFNPTTTMSFVIGHRSSVTLKMYDVLGREVATLIDEQKSAGSYNFEFRNSDFELSSGVYFYRLVVSSIEPLQSASFTSVKKMILMR